MSDYKLVPVEITDEMAEASGCEGCFRKSVHDQAQDMWTAMLAAAPAVQGEPVAYASFAENGNIQIWCSDPIQAETLRHQYGDRIKPLYAAPQPAEQQPDVDRMVEALNKVMHCRYFVLLSSAVQHEVSATLAAHRKGGGA